MFRDRAARMIPGAIAVMICALAMISAGARSDAEAMEAPIVGAWGAPTAEASDAATAPGQFPLMKWGSQGAAEGQFNYPGVITIDTSGNIYVADVLNYRIQKFDSGGRFLRMWGWGVQNGNSAFQICTSGCQTGLNGGGNGQFTTPAGMAIDASGTLHVVDLSRDWVQKFDLDGNYITRWGVFGSSEGEFDGASGAAIGSNDKLYILDNYLHRIQRFNLYGNFERMWGWGVQDGASAFQICTSGCQGGSSGPGNGQFHFPSRVAIDSSGNVYVTDESNDRVQKFNENGIFLTKFGTTGSGDGQLDRPAGIWVDARGNVYVADADNYRVVQFDTSGSFIRAFGWGVRDGSATFQVCTSGCQKGISGAGDGQFDGVVDLVGDSFSNLYVVDSGNHRVQNLGPALGIFVGDRGHGPGQPHVPSEPLVALRAQLAGTGR